MTTTPAFTYDAIRKVAVARGTAGDGSSWTIEFLDRMADDSMRIVVHEPSGIDRPLTATEDDFVFEGETVTLRGLPDVALRMPTLYLKKLRGFTRGNIPTPDVPGPSLP